MLYPPQSDDGGSASNARSASEWAFSVIFQKIVDGRLKAGQHVTEETLSRDVAVSRTPLRDAIRRLEMTGLLVRRQNRGLRVADLSLEEMIRLSLLREALEDLLVRHVTERYAAGEISLSSLEELVSQMEAIDPERGLSLILGLGSRFHHQLSRLSGDPLGARFLEHVFLSFERYRHLIDHRLDRAYDITAEHVAILRAIREGDADEAANCIRKHLQNARVIYAERLSELPKDVLGQAPSASGPTKDNRTSGEAR